MEELYCRRCGNTKEFHKTSKGYYCEACKKMGRFYVDTHSLLVYGTFQVVRIVTMNYPIV